MTRTRGICARKLVEDLPGGIGAAVVDDDDLEVGRQPAGDLHREDHEARDGPAVVVRGKNMLSPTGRVERSSGIEALNRTHGNSLRARTERAYFGRATRRQGSIADSTITLAESFDAPCRRSTKRDRDLAAPESGLRRLPRELDDECIAVGADRGERKLFERFAPPAAEPARAIANREVGDRPDVAVRERAEQSGAERASSRCVRPARIASRSRTRPAPSAAISRGTSAGLCDRSASIWQDVRGIGAQRHVHPVDVRAPEAALAGSVQHLHARSIRRRMLVGDAARSRPGDESSTTRIRRPSSHQELLEQSRKVVALVVGRDDDQRPHRAISWGLRIAAT